MMSQGPYEIVQHFESAFWRPKIKRLCSWIGIGDENTHHVHTESVETLCHVDVTSGGASVFTGLLVRLVKAGSAVEGQRGFLELALYIVISFILLLEGGSTGSEYC